MAEHLHEQEPNSEAPGAPAGGGGAAHVQELSKLFEQHNRRLVSFLIQRLGNEAEAMEVAQEAYVRLLQLDTPGAVSFLRAYLYKTAANIALDRIRHRTRTRGMEDVHEDDLTDSLSPDREVQASDELKAVQRALSELDPRHRQAFLLERFSDKSTDQIGRELNISGRQARTWIKNVAVYCRLRLDGVPADQAKERAFK